MLVYSHKFPYRTDCILSHLRLPKPSSITHIRSVSDALPLTSKSSLGSKHAGCPIKFIITVPKLLSLGHIHLSVICLVEFALRVFPNNKICRNIIKILLAAGLGIKNATAQMFFHS